MSGNKNEIKNYFGHTRIEDMADNKIRRVIEVQSDLYQKGNLEREAMRPESIPVSEYRRVMSPEDLKQYEALRVKNQMRGLDVYDKKKWDTLEKKYIPEITKGRDSELSKLQQYSNPTAHFRMVREEIKKAADDGKTKLQFPTGETAMKIEGLGNTSRFVDAKTNEILGLDMPGLDLDPKVGREIKMQGIVTGKQIGRAHV